MKDKHTNSPIRQRRKAMGLTMQELGELTGIEPGTIAGAELGRNGISKATSEKLAAVFQCDAGELLEEAGSYARQRHMEKPGAREGKKVTPAGKQAAQGAKTETTWHDWEEMTEMKRGGHANGLDMRLVNERNPMKSLKRLRERAKLSTWEAAKRAGIPAYQWEGLEKGETKPDIRAARRIAAMFHTEWCWIFREVICQGLPWCVNRPES